MTKIIKLNGEEVTLGTDDGKIRKVRIYDVHFAPAEGDEVEVYESDGEIIVTKKETNKKYNNNSIEQSNNNYVQSNNNNVLLIFLYISMIISIVACFLPILSVSFLGTSYSINYVYNNGEVADGIFIVGIQFLAIISLLIKKKTAVAALEIIAVFVFGYTVYNMFTKISSSLKISIYSFLGAGFYILAIALLSSAILATIHYYKK